MKLAVGQRAPEFTLRDQDGKEHSLSDYRGQWVVLYFYPSDDTPGCTKQACDIRDAFPQFGDLHAQVLGVCTDSVESHKKFAEKHGLPFALLADAEKKAVEAYGVWGQKQGADGPYLGTLRTSFLIDPKGNIAKIYESVNPQTHADDVLKDLEARTQISVEMI